LFLAAGLLLPVPSAFGEGFRLSGIVDSSFRAALAPDYGADGGWDGAFSTGFEQFANLRFQAPAGERATVFAAVNLAAASGTALPVYAAGAGEAAGSGRIVLHPYSAGKGYASALELERLYFRVEGEESDIEAGLMRIAFGYGQAWRPLDFLNPPNPLFPDARPRGSLGAAVTTYPSDLWTGRFFLVSGEDPLETNGEGTTAGAAAEYHGPAASLQVLYAVRAPVSGFSRPAHRFGLSLKAEAGAAFVLEGLYTLEGDAAATGRLYGRPWDPLRGLQASAGADYSFFGGKLVTMVQYLYNGAGVIGRGGALDGLYDPAGGEWTSLPPGERTLRGDIPLADLNRRNYLSASLTRLIDDYTRAALFCVAGLDDGSLVPVLSAEHEPFQGLLLSLSLRLPLDRRVLGSDSPGELGPLHTGTAAEISLKARLRF
jgi:hypothetical protein